jgi:hypothetical protein
MRALMLRRIEAKLFGPEINFAEKAVIVRRLHAIFPPAEIPARLLAALNIPARPEIVGKWLNLSRQGAPFLEAAIAGGLSERVALEIARWEEEAKRPVLQLIGELRCSESIQAELAERFSEVAQREGQSRVQVLQSPGMRSILSDKKLNHREKTQAVRDLLFRQRFPRLHARQQETARRIAETGLPGGVRLVPPAGFEGNEWRMHLAFTSEEELKEALDGARDLAGSGKLASIMNPGRAGSGERRPEFPVGPSGEE